MKTIISTSLKSTSSTLRRLSLSPDAAKKMDKKFTVADVIGMMESQIFADFTAPRGEFENYISESPDVDRAEAVIKSVYDQLARASKFSK